MKKEIVCVLIIIEEHCDIHAEVFTDRDIAFRAMFDYCVENWDYDWGDPHKLFMDEVVEIYTEHNRIRWEITEAPFYS